MIDTIIQYCHSYQLRLYEPIVILVWLLLSYLSLIKLKKAKTDYLSGKISPKYSEMRGFELPEKEIYEYDYRYRLNISIIMFVYSIVMLVLYIGLITFKIIF